MGKAQRPGRGGFAGNVFLTHSSTRSFPNNSHASGQAQRERVLVSPTGLHSGVGSVEGVGGRQTSKEETNQEGNSLPGSSGRKKRHQATE